MKSYGEYSTIEVQLTDAVGRIGLNRPDKGNAINTTLMHEVAQALDAIDERAEIRGVIICGSERFFSTGADLNEALAIKTAQEYTAYNRRWRELTSAIERHGKPVIACISGYCYTGGLEMALACDLRIACRNARFAMTSSRIGSVAGAGGTQRLPRLVGSSNAKRMLFSAEEIDASEALRIGLIDELVSDGEAENRGCELVELYTSRAPLSLTWSKMAVNVGANLDLESALDLEATLSSRAFATEDKQEGMQAFLEKRSANFRGQ